MMEHVYIFIKAFVIFFYAVEMCLNAYTINSYLLQRFVHLIYVTTTIFFLNISASAEF